MRTSKNKSLVFMNLIHIREENPDVPVPFTLYCNLFSVQEVAGKIGFWKNIDLSILNEQDPKYSTVVHIVQSTIMSYV
jgi:hypothetical protein